jgi:7-carboxy-7-deazaguanine synthase
MTTGAQTLTVNSVYLTFNGEQNAHGIGSPCVFLRLAGCPIRCYAETLGVLCDTPESLERKAGEVLSIPDIVERVKVVSGDCRILTLTGGDPLWNNHDALKLLLFHLTAAGYSICIETSGVVAWERYRRDGVAFVLDYKLPSCGDSIYEQNLLRKYPEKFEDLSPTDVVKFVIHGNHDFELAKQVLKEQYGKCPAMFAFGVYWEGPLQISQVVTSLKSEMLLDKVYINVQLHKMIYRELSNVLPKDI